MHFFNIFPHTSGENASHEAASPELWFAKSLYLMVQDHYFGKRVPMQTDPNFCDACTADMAAENYCSSRSALPTW